MGADPDLLIWIPKDAAQQRTTESSRPLQLPTTLRRLGGAAIADVAGPPLEASFSPYQAAHRGGSCGPNITAVFGFLGQGPALPPPPAPTNDLTASLLGGAAAGTDRWLQQFPTWDDAPDTAGGVLFADQSKAFERLAWAWIAAVLARWRLPTWLRRGLLGLVIGRRVASLLPSGAAIIRMLLCGVGMGGPASPLIWMVAYDPVVFGVACAAGAPTPTYVDDLAALVRNPRQCQHTALLLLAASKCAGLIVDTHCCAGIAGPAAFFGASELATLRTLPVAVEWAEDEVAIWGLPPSLLLAIFDILRPGNACHAVSRPCRCKLKTAVVPVAGVARWRAAMVGGIVSGGNIAGHWRYLARLGAIGTRPPWPRCRPHHGPLVLPR